MPQPRVFVDRFSGGDNRAHKAGGDMADGRMVARTRNLQIEVRRERGGVAQTLVSELMILANELVATHCANSGIPIPYRTQAAPALSEEIISRVNALPEAPAYVRNWMLVHESHPASVQVQPGRHHSLGLEAYSRATSPIRRYWDLIVHHQVKAHLRSEVLPYTKQDVENMIPSLLLREQHVKQLEKHISR